jgi:hypothetical protein
MYSIFDLSSWSSKEFKIKILEGRQLGDTKDGTQELNAYDLMKIRTNKYFKESLEKRKSLNLSEEGNKDINESIDDALWFNKKLELIKGIIDK